MLFRQYLLELGTGSRYSCNHVEQELAAQHHGAKRLQDKEAGLESPACERREQHGGGGALVPGSAPHDPGSRGRGEEAGARGDGGGGARREELGEEAASEAEHGGARSRRRRRRGWEGWRGGGWLSGQGF